MICRKAECLVFMKLAGSISQADECLFDLVHPLAEAALQDYLQQDIQYAQHSELFPIGQPQRSTDHPLEDVYFRSGGGGTAAFRGASRTGTEFLQLKHTPVSAAGLQVFEDTGAYAGQASGSFDNTETELVAGTDFYLDIDDAAGQVSRSGILYRIGAWPVEPRTVKAVYYGGFNSVHLAGRFGGALKLAALKTIAANFWGRKQFADTNGLGPKMSESIGKYSYAHAAQVAILNFMTTVPSDAKQDLQVFRNYGRAFG